MLFTSVENKPKSELTRELNVNDKELRQTVNWRIFTLFEVNIIFDLSHKLNDFGEYQNEFPI
jgi:hypothetical protein